MTPQQKEQQEAQLESRLMAEKEGDVRGKAKAVAIEIKNVYDKVASLGTNVFTKFKELLDQNGLQINSIEPNAIQTALNTRINSLNEVNNETLLKLDNGLDQIMLRVQMRKKIAENLEGMANKDQIGRLFEEKMNALEAVNFEQQQNVENFRKKEELLREFTKYTELVKSALIKNAFKQQGESNETILKKAITVPSVGIAYHIEGQVQYFKYWIEERDGRIMVYCMDNMYGRIQKFDPAGDVVGRNAWVFADTAGKEYQEFTTNEQYRDRRGFPSKKMRMLMLGKDGSENTTEDEIRRLRNDQELSLRDDIATMLKNQEEERGYINAADRNYNPTREERQIWENYETKFSELKQQNLQQYRSNPEHAPYGHNLREMFQYTNSPEYRESLRRIMSGVQERPRESLRNNNDLLEYPSDGVLRWGEIRLTRVESGGASVEQTQQIGRLKPEVKNSQLTVSRVEIEGRRASTGNVSIGPNNEIILRAERGEDLRVRTGRTIEITVEQTEADGSKFNKKLVFRVEGREQMDVSNEVRLSYPTNDPPTLEIGRMNTKGRTPEPNPPGVAELAPLPPGLTVESATMNFGSSTVPVEYNSTTRQVLLSAGQELIPGPDHPVITLQIKDAVTGRITQRILNIRLQDRPEAVDQDIAIKNEEKLTQFRSNIPEGKVPGLYLDPTSNPYVRRKIVDSAGNDHPLLTLERENGRDFVTVKNGKKIDEDTDFFIIADVPGRVAPQQEKKKEYTLILAGERTPTVADIGTLKPGQQLVGPIEQKTNSDTQLLEFERLPNGVKSREVIGIYNPLTPLAPPIPTNIFSFGNTPETRNMLYLNKTSGNPAILPHGQVLVLMMSVENDVGNKTVIPVPIRIENPAPDQEYTTLENGQKEATLSRGTINASSDENLGIKLAPSKSGVLRRTIKGAHPDTRDSAVTAQLDFAPDGSMILKAGNTLQEGKTYFIEVETQIAGSTQPKTEYILLTIGPRPAILAPSTDLDFGFVNDQQLTYDRGPLTAPASRPLLLSELNPLDPERVRNGIERTITLATQNGQPIYRVQNGQPDQNNLIEMDGNDIRLRPGKTLPVGPVEITFALRNRNDNTTPPLEKKVVLNILPEIASERLPQDLMALRDRLATENTDATNLNFIPVNDTTWEVANNDQVTRVEKRGTNYVIEAGGETLSFPEIQKDLAFFSALKINTIINSSNQGDFSTAAVNSREFFLIDSGIAANPRLIEKNNTTGTDAVVLTNPSINIEMFRKILNLRMTDKVTEANPNLTIDTPQTNLYRNRPFTHSIIPTTPGANYRYSIDGGQTWVRVQGNQILIPKEQIPAPAAGQKNKLVIVGEKSGFRTTVKTIELNLLNPYSGITITPGAKDLSFISQERPDKNINYTIRTNDAVGSMDYKFEAGANNEVKILKREITRENDQQYKHVASATANLETGILENLTFQNELGTDTSFSNTFNITIDPTTDPNVSPRSVTINRKS